MRKWENDSARAQSITSRHNMIAVIVVSLSLGAVLLGGIKGCTDYNIEKLNTPVKYEQIDTYERGGKQ